MSKPGDLCWADLGSVVGSWPCRIIDTSTAPAHVIDARPLSGKHSILVSYTLNKNSPVAWGWLAKKCLSPFPSEQKPSSQVPGSMQQSTLEVRVKEALIAAAESYELPSHPPCNPCWLSEEGPIKGTGFALVDATMAIRSLREAAVQKTEKKAEQAISDER